MGIGRATCFVGAGVGIAWGIYAHNRKTPLILGYLPGGLMVGYHKEF